MKSIIIKANVCAFKSFREDVKLNVISLAIEGFKNKTEMNKFV